MKAVYLGGLLALLLAGCAGHEHALVKESRAPFVAGELVHDRGRNNHLVLETPDRRYEAHGFAVARVTDWAALRERYYGTDPRRWDRIFAGLDTTHQVVATQAVARASDGAELSCRLSWKARAKPAGVCTDRSGAEFPVRFQ